MVRTSARRGPGLRCVGADLPGRGVPGYLLTVLRTSSCSSQFRSAEDVAIYYAASKTIALVSFIYYSVAQTIAHKFVEYDVSGNREGLAVFLKQSVRLTFWPSVVVIIGLLALGHPLLRLFGREFTSGYYLMFIIAIGLLARASVGPAERLLNMLGERRARTPHLCGVFRHQFDPLCAVDSAVRIGRCGGGKLDCARVRIRKPVCGREIPLGTALLHFRRSRRS